MVTYTNNIPQGNQQIAVTQPLIQSNFGYLEDAINQEHNFDATDPSKTYHLQASMPNLAMDPSSLPTGTNGMYYVTGGIPKFFNTTAKFLPYSSCSSFTLSGGPMSINSSPSLISAVPDNSCGQIYIIRPSNSSQYFIGTFNSANGVVVTHLDHSNNIISFGNGTDLNIFASTSGASYTIRWVIQVNTP